MTIKKYGDVEKLEVVTPAEKDVIDDHKHRTGKNEVSKFTDVEREALRSDMDQARE